MPIGRGRASRAPTVFGADGLGGRLIDRERSGAAAPGSRGIGTAVISTGWSKPRHDLQPAELLKWVAARGAAATVRSIVCRVRLGTVALAVAAVAGVGFGLPVMATADLDEVAAALRGDPVYVDPGAERALDDAVAAQLRDAIAGPGTPVYVAALPASAAGASVAIPPQWRPIPPRGSD